MSETLPAPPRSSPLRTVLWAIASALVFLTSSVGGLLLHVGTPAMRATIASLTNELLSDVFYGQLRLGTVEDISARSIKLGRVLLFDEQGEQVLALQDAEVKLDSVALIYDIFFGGTRLDIVLTHARVEDASVKLIPEPTTGEPTLSRALTPRPTEAESDKKKKERRYVRVYLPIVELGSVQGEIDLEGLENVRATLANVHGKVLFSPKGIAVDVDRFGTSVSGILGIDVRGSGSFSLRAPGPLQLDFSGFADEAEIQARVGVEDGRLDAEATVPRLAPRTMKKWISAWPLRQPVSARVKAAGKLPHLDTEAKFSLGDAEIDIRGPVELTEAVDANLDVQLHDVELHSLIEDAPHARVEASAKVNVHAKGNDYRVGLDGTTEATAIEGVLVPAARFTLVAAPERLSGDVTLLEPGGTIFAKAKYEDGRLDAKARVPELRLRNHRRLPGGLRGISSLEAQVQLEGKRLHATAKGTLRDFGVAPVTAASAAFEASFDADTERLSEARFSADVDATGLGLGALQFDHAEVSARGNRHSIDVETKLSAAGERRIGARGRLHSDLSVTNAHVTLERGPVSAEADVAKFDWKRRIFDIPHVAIRGREGRLEGHIQLQPGLAEGALSARDLNVARVLGRLVGTAVPVAGRLDLDTEFAIGSDLQRGRLQASVSGLAVDNWGHSDVTLLAQLDGRQLTGALRGKDELGFTVDGKWDALLGGHPLELASFETVTGTAEVALLGVPTGPIALALDNESLPELEGKLGVRALLQRTGPTGFPNAFVEIGASVERARIAFGDEPEVLSDVNTYFSAAFDAGSNQLNGAGSVNDVHGALVNLSTALPFDPEAWFGDARAAYREFKTDPINVLANVPARNISQLPLLDADGVEGTVEAQIALFGTLTEPRISLLADARDMQAPGLRADTPVSVNLNGQYAPTTGDVDLKVVGSSNSRSVLLGRLYGTAPWRTAATGEGWAVAARAGIDRMPLQLFTPLVEQDLAGSVSGQIALIQGSHPELNATLDFDQLSSGRAVLGHGTLQLKGEPGRILGTFALDDRRRTLSVLLNAGANTTQVPFPNQLETADVSVQANDFDAAALAPAVESVLARLSGDLDAELRVYLKRVTSVEPGVPHEWKTSLEGEARLSDGSAYIEALGLELRDISLNAIAETSAAGTTLSLEDIRAKARSREENLEGQGRLLVEGTTLKSGTAAVRLRSVPITLQGLNLGKARGQALAKFERRHGWDRPDPWHGKDYMLFEIDLLDWQMEAATSASRELIDLSDNSDIIIVQTTSEEQTDPEAMPVRFIVHLGERTTFALADLQVPLHGDVAVDISGESTMTGELTLRRGGRVPIFGRVFRIVRGSLKLNPREPSNPNIDITLAGRSGSDEPIFVSITGTLKDPITQPGPAELQALLGGGAATVLGSGVQALGVNQLLGNSVQLRVNAADEEDAETSYGASIQLDDDLWFEAAYQRGQEATLNQQQGEVVSGTLDYRFQENWSLRTKVGNTGGSIDLLWQYRY